MWLKSFITEDGHANCYKPIPNISEFDINNNDVDVNSTTKQKILSSTYKKVNFESNNQTYFNVRLTRNYNIIRHLNIFVYLLQDNIYNGRYIKFDSPDSCLSNNVTEQTEPIDLSCGVKTINSNAAKKLQKQVKIFYITTFF